MIRCMGFTDREDSATLGSDMSAVSGLREAVHHSTALLICPASRKQKR